MPMGGDLGMGVTFTLRNMASGPAQQAGRSLLNLQGVTERVSMGINAAVSRITSGLFGLTFAVTTLLGPFIAAGGAAATFNKQMSEVAAKAQISKVSEQYAELSEQSIRLGEATKFTAVQVAEGQTFLAQTGLQVNDILGAMPGLLSLAAAGNLDLARSADIASNILIAMGLEAKEMNRVADVLAATSVKANVNVEQLGESFKFAAPFAQQLGISLEQTAALVGMLGDMGVQGTLAGTAIKNFAAQTGKLTPDKLAKYGLVMGDIADSAGNMLPLDQVFRNVINQVRTLGSLERVGALSELFGLRGNVALAAAMSKSSKDLKTFTVTLENSAGAANEISGKMLDNLAGDMIKFRSVVQTTLITAGQGLETMMRPVVQRVTKLIQGFQQLMKTNVGQWVVKVTAAIAGLTVALVALGFVVGVLIPAMGTLIAMLANPIFLGVAAAIVAIISPILILMKAVKSFRDVMEGAESSTGFMGFLQKVGGTVTGIVQIFRSWNGETFSMSENMRDALSRIGILDFVLNIGTWVIRVKEFFKGIIAAVKGVASALRPVWEVMKAAISGFIDALGMLLPSIDGTTSSIERWHQVGQLVGTFITNWIVPAVSALALAFSAVSTGLQFTVGLLKSWWQAFAPIRDFIASVTQNALALPFQVLADVLNGIDLKQSLFTRGLEFVNTVVEKFSNLVTKLKDIIMENLSVPLQNVFELVGKVGDAATSFFNPEDVNNTSLPKRDGGIDTMAKTIAENKAAAMVPGQTPPTIIDKTVTKTEQVSVTVQLEDDTLAERVVENEQLEAARN